MPDLGFSWDAFVELNSCFWASSIVAWIDKLAAANGRAVSNETLEPANLCAVAAGKPAHRR